MMSDLCLAYHDNTKNPASERSNQEFVRWRLEQDAMDRQRRLNAAKERTMQNNLHQYSPREQNGFLQQRNQEEVDHRAAESQRQEAERQKRTLIRQRQEEKRREQAERGRRRREESERRQKELADDLKRQKEAELAEEEVRKNKRNNSTTGGETKGKQKDLADIKKRKPKERDLNTPDSYIPPSSRSEAISKPIRNQQPSQLSHWSESSSVFPVKQEGHKKRLEISTET
ncbi:hypothetical protein EB796_014882 [Bugula neritina]|uniref:Uncharacterized protein n=1 Tax=Bugula neritina TaxID=10212 RepID=A0A7J7JN31_BUGNE|nr:hypothetical protein EB796_014882 [Bugula neritina]